MLEVKIEELTNAINNLTLLLKQIEYGREAEQMLVSKIQESKPVKIKEPVIVEQPVTSTPTPAAEPVTPVMPAAPTFEPACPTHDVAKAPFNDGKGLIDYVMTAYKEMGAEKGAQIQGVLVEMGLQNVNELRPTEYDAFFAKVEALK